MFNKSSFKVFLFSLNPFFSKSPSIGYIPLTNISYLRTNNAYKELFGADGVSEGNPMDYIFYEYKNDVLEAFSNAIKNDEITECQYKRRVQQGNALWVSKKLQYIGKVGEEKSIFVANLTDVTMQKEVETELKKLKKVMNSGNKDKPKKLLVVDDSELSSRIIKDIFANSYEVMLAKNGLEGLSSMAKKAIAEGKTTTLRDLEEVTAKDVIDAAKAGDTVADEIFDKFCDYLGYSLAATAAVVDPEAFIIGGGVSKAGDILIDVVQKYYKQYVWPGCRDKKFVLAKLGNDAGIYGAASYVL